MQRLIVPLLALSFALPMHAQQPSWDAGGFFQLGLRYTSTPRDDEPQLPGVAGLYAEWLPAHQHFIYLGAELRADRGGLAGPRVSIGGSGPWHAYAGALFGRTQSTYNPGTVIYPAGTPPPDNTRYGLTSEGIFGVEYDLASHCRWRILELAPSTFSGIPGSHPFTIQTGIVLHFRSADD